LEKKNDFSKGASPQLTERGKKKNVSRDNPKKGRNRFISGEPVLGSDKGQKRSGSLRVGGEPPRQIILQIERRDMI